MSKIKFGNAALYLLFFANLVYALSHGFEWIHYVTFGLTAVVLVLDIAEVIIRAGK